MWLDNELSLFKQNIEMLRVNQRIGRLAYLWAVCGLMVSKFLAYLIFVLLIGIIQGTPLQGSQYLSYIYFGSLQIIHIIATIFILKRRLNDCGSSLWYMILVPIAYLSLWVYWGMSFSWASISETILNASFYWDGFFWQYFILVCFALPLSVPDIFYPCLLCSMLLFSVVPRKLWLRDNTVELKGIIFGNKVIDVLWGERNDLTTSQIKAINSFYSRQDKRSLLTDLYKSILIDSLWPNGRSTVRQWNLFNVYLAFIIYNMILNYNIENCALRYALYVYLIYTIIIMIFRRLRDSNSSIFWIIGLFVPIINIYVLYLLYNKTSALYDKESNSIFYYAL